MNAPHALYPEVARFEIDQRLRAAAARHQRRQVQSLNGWPYRSNHRTRGHLR